MGDYFVLPDLIEVGQRNDTLARAAGSLRREGFGPDAIYSVFKSLLAGGRIENPPDNPMTNRELWSIAQSIGSRRSERVEREKAERAIIDSIIPIPLSRVPASPPKPLRLGYLDPEDHTILFGDGGTGKGIVAAWWAATLSNEGETVFVLDYEMRARHEWRPRVEAFGGDLDRVLIAQPMEAIWDVAEAIGEQAAAVRATWLVVDSAAYACMGREVEKAEIAIKYSRAIATINLPTLSLAHTTKADADPRHPFGSVFWSNGARVTIGMTGTGADPRVLTNKKTNQRAPFEPVTIDWDWIDSGVPATLVVRPARLTLRDRIFAALGPTGSMTVEQLHAAVCADGGQAVTIDGVKKALLRNPQNFVGDGDKPQLWTRAVHVRRVPSAAQATTSRSRPGGVPIANRSVPIPSRRRTGTTAPP